MVGQRPNQERVDEAEDGGVSRDRERDGDERDGGEAGRFDEAAEGEFEFLKPLVIQREARSWGWCAPHAGPEASMRTARR